MIRGTCSPPLRGEAGSSPAEAARVGRCRLRSVPAPTERARRQPPPRVSKSTEIDGRIGRASGTRRWSQTSPGLFGNPCFLRVCAHFRHGGRNFHSPRNVKQFSSRTTEHGTSSPPFKGRCTRHACPVHRPLDWLAFRRLFSTGSATKLFDQLADACPLAAGQTDELKEGCFAAHEANRRSFAPAEPSAVINGAVPSLGVPGSWGASSTLFFLASVWPRDDGSCTRT